MELSEKTIILTGGARIGKAVARALAEKGANLVVTYSHSKDAAEEIAKAVLYLLDADFVTGHILTIDGGRTIA